MERDFKEQAGTGSIAPPDILEPSPVSGSENTMSAGGGASEGSNQALKQKLQKADADRKARPADISVPPHDNTPRAPTTTLDPASPPRNSLAQAGIGARRSSSPFAGSASPSRAMRSSSPRHLSPATSQIFERDVQEPAAAPELSPAIPSHIQTEDHIPPVLEASSLAITDDHLNPDNVEIIMSSQHQSAAVVTGNVSEAHSPFPGGSAHPGLEPSLGVPHDPLESGSSYGAIDPMDPRRLSFVSFADVVHAEHTEPRAESIGGNRSPSPIHSPLSAERVPMSPPLSMPGSFKVPEGSPSRAGAASPGSLGGGQQGELTIETMRQTMEKTGSEAAGASNLPLSASSHDDGRAPHSFR